MGAERGGNAAGSIPAWTGGITAPPPDYVPGEHHPDPYAGDSVLFTVTAGDLETRGELLCDGQKALLRAHPWCWRGRGRSPTRGWARPSRSRRAASRSSGTTTSAGVARASSAARGSR